MRRAGRGGCVAALCGLLFPAGAVFAGDDRSQTMQASAALEQALERIEGCRSSLAPDVDVGFDRIALRCPDLPQLLEATQLAHWLPSGWKRDGNNLTSKGLAELQSLLQTELTRVPLRAAPSTASLAAILGNVNAEVPSTGWWARFRAWLRRALQAEQPDSQAPAWMRSLHIPPAVLAKLVIGFAVVGALLVLAVVTNELRAAGILRRRRARSKQQSPADNAALGPPLRSRSIDAVPLADRPAMLLRIAADRLSAAAPHSRDALTARELQQLLRSSDFPLKPAAAPILASLVETAELIRYAQIVPPDSNLEEVVAQGRILLGENAA